LESCCRKNEEANAEITLVMTNRGVCNESGGIEAAVVGVPG
jgi:hypothetical protein